MDIGQAQELLNNGKISQKTFDVMKQKMSEPDPVYTKVKEMTAPIIEPVANAMGSFSDYMSNDDEVKQRMMNGEVIDTTPGITPVQSFQANAQPVEEIQPMEPVTSQVASPVPPKVENLQPLESSVTTTTSKIKPAGVVQAESQIEKSIQDQKKAKEQQAKVIADKSAEQYNLEQGSIKSVQEANDKRKEIEDKANADYETRLADLDAQVNDLKSQKYEGYWADKTSGNKILAAIAVGLGAYGAAINGGKNSALDIMQKAMDDDAQKYKTNIDNQIKVISESRLSEESKQRIIKQKVDSLEAYKLGQIEQTKAKVESLGTKYAGTEAGAKLADIQAQLDEKSATLKGEIAGKYADETQTQVTKQNALLGKIGRYRKDNDGRMYDSVTGDYTEEPAPQVEGGPIKKRPGESDVEFRGRVATAEKNKQTVAEIQTRNATIHSNIDKAIEMIRKNGTYESFGPHNEILDGMMTEVATDTAKLTDPTSTARESEVTSFKKSLVEPGLKTSNKTAIKLLEDFKARMNSRVDDAYRARGMTAPGGEKVNTEPTTKMIAPDGSLVEVPNSEVAAATKAGGKVAN